MGERMRVDITGRHIELTPALREFAEEKLAKLERLLDGAIEAHVVLSIIKHRHIAEIQIKSRSAVLSGTEETDDLYVSISEVVDKLERQAQKHKEKIHDHKHRRGPRDPSVTAAIEAQVAEAEGGEEPPSTDPRPRIVHSRRYTVRPMSAEDAVMELEASDDQLLVFREARSERINVLFRQKDGNYGLIDAES
jgi:putative sigma-54 modulation protein